MILCRYLTTVLYLPSISSHKHLYSSLLTLTPAEHCHARLEHLHYSPPLYKLRIYVTRTGVVPYPNGL